MPGSATAMIELYQEAAPLPPSFPSARCQTMLYTEILTEADRDLFFPDKFGRAAHGTRSPQDTARMSKDVCNGTGEWAGKGECPHRAECRLWGVARKERFGVWGGMSERDRARLRKTMATEREEMRRRRSDAAKRGWYARTPVVVVQFTRAPEWLQVWGHRKDRYADVGGHRYRAALTEDGWEVFQLTHDGTSVGSLGVAQDLAEARRLIADDVTGQDDDGDEQLEEAG